MATLLTALTVAFGLPVAAKPAGPLADPNTSTAGWSIDSQSGCALWNPRPQRDESVTWSGVCLNGLATGPGVAQWYESGQIGNRLEGEYRNGRQSGEVTVTYPNGAKYKGTLNEEDGNRDGEGTFIWPNARKYIGEWAHGKRNGNGTMYAADGTVGQSGLWIHGDFIGANAEAGDSVSVSSLLAPGHVEIALFKDRGTFKVPVIINGAIVLDFIVDSGATDVSVPADVAMTLMRTGTLQDGDFLGSQDFILADGSSVPSQTFRIRSLKIGNHVIEDVTAGIGGAKSNLLLGQSFLSKFKAWSIDNRRQALILEW